MGVLAGPLRAATEASMLLQLEAELEADSEDRGSEEERREQPSSCSSRRWKGLLPLAALGFVASLLLWLRLPRRSPDQLRDSVQLQELQAGGFFLCSGMSSCGVRSLETWREDPASLAAQVDPSLQRVPGIPANVFAPVAQHWQSAPPAFKQAPVQLDGVASFIQQLLRSNPFGTGSQVPYIAFHEKGQGQVVSITQKQLAFVVANVMMGNDIGPGNGLTAAIHRCSARGAKAFVFSLLSLLAVLSRELSDGGQGSTLIAAVPRAKDDSWKTLLERQLVVPTQVHKELGSASGDFMAGGIDGQAMTDIAGTVVGGGAALCDLANSQDESLVQFYSEVLAFAFFAAPGKMLPVPWVLLGARRYMGELTGESASSGRLLNRCGSIAQSDWLNQAIPITMTRVALANMHKAVAPSAFVAVASVCSGSVGSCPNAMAVNNNCESQRRHWEVDVSQWYQAFEPGMYPQPVQQAIATVIKRVGTGPWGAGVWWGDSQQYFLTVLLATSLLSHRPKLDYYIYDHFCENPGNQCFVLGSEGCEQCVAQSKATNIHVSRCGSAGVFDMLQRFAGKPSKHLFLALKNVGGPPAQVFDTLSSWTPSQVELATPVQPGSRVAASQPQAPTPAVASPDLLGPTAGAAGYAGGPVSQPVPAPYPYNPVYYSTPSPSPVGVPVPVPVGVGVPVGEPYPAVPAAPADRAATSGHCVSFLHRRLCVPQFRLPHFR